ncbi:MAG: alpha/beta hydrolase [Candidatus Limnocylindria bacterium]
MTHDGYAGGPRDRQIPSASPTSDYRAVEFSSDGAVLRGRLYMPGRPARVVIVMGHGFSATIPMVMDRYAECFRDRGLAVLAFDHRGHGSSDGEPRGEINYWVQARGYIDAIGAARAMTELNQTQVALWSDSMSARVALGVTALDERVDALVCQVPALGDTVGADGRYGSGWTNRVVFTTPNDAPDFDPFACAPGVRVPTLFVMSPADEMPGAVSHVTRGVFDRIRGPAELMEVDGGHFGLLEYPSVAFDQAVDAQADFLGRALGLTR